MAYDDVITRNDNDELAVRTVSATEQATVVNPNDVYTRDTDGNLAIRVVGNGGSGDSHNKGFFATQQALEEAYPTAEDGDYAIVGSTDTVWVWDSDTGESGAWIDTDTKGQVTSVNGQTGAVIVQEVIQYGEMPVASQENVDKIVQYVGATDSTYTNGYYYKCDRLPEPVYPASISQTVGNSLSDLSVDGYTFYVDCTNETGTFVFIYNGTYWGWSYEDPSEYSFTNEDLQQFGITFTGTPVANDELTIILTEENAYAWTRLDVQPVGATIDDSSTSSLTSTWSASKLNTTIGNIETLLSQI